MKKVLVFLVALLSVAMFANPALTVSGSASFELVFDENGFDLVAGPAGSGTWGAEGTFEAATTDGTWTAAWEWDGSDVTVSGVAFEGKLFDLSLAKNALTIEPAAVAGLSVTLEDLGAKDYVNKTKAVKDAKMEFADYSLTVEYALPVAKFGLDSIFSDVSVAGNYGVNYFSKDAEVLGYFDASGKEWELPAAKESVALTGTSTYTYTKTTWKLDDLTLLSGASYTAPFYGVDFSADFAVVAGLSVSAHYGMSNAGGDFVSSIKTTTLKATKTTYTSEVAVGKSADYDDGTKTEDATDITAVYKNYTAKSKHELDKEYVLTLSYSNEFALGELLSLTPHVKFFNKINQTPAKATKDKGYTSQKFAIIEEKATKATSSDATQIEAGLDLSVNVAGLTLGVEDTYYYSLVKDDTQYAFVNVSAGYDMDMVSLSALLKSAITMEKGKDMDYIANVNVNATVTPLENVTVAADVYYDLDKDDTNNDNAMGYSVTADYEYSIFNFGVVAGTYNGKFSANDEDMHWYAYVKGSVEF
ncbi:hypothetical protein Marpi_1730 [Marinitoga piezophila KA3]|uniref:Alginate export domain-containing protein n=1 Tax=Marinitoga piezophila (strain DSM 14283 / JCM 11233 / KA3) TaxID=443254 RepID=H2J5H2_MARPK|nr:MULTISPECIES: hypothetical protein [Marinitoga]AEX86116.1 hypothetical protein Marpi_1730 [Marinitoga piezophila KA3]APT76532.1 hypothetical protein LN42_09210 [Marinitoga sp. 1137]